jgi:GTPase involved in cell partitioning and DNA repair
MNFIEEIKKLIRQANATNVINDLIDFNMKISGYLCYMAEQEAELLKKKLDAYNERKDFEANFVLTSDEGVTKAEKIATVKSKTHRATEVITEYEFQKMKSFRTQCNEFSQALTQKIAALRSEKANTRNQEG